MTASRFAIFILAGLLTSCWGLPRNFASLSLDQKISAYERKLKWGGAESSEARAQISWHGRDSAARMVPYLRGEKSGLPVGEAIAIIWDVQLRGCQLKGTNAETALLEVAEHNQLGNADRIALIAALKAIAENTTVAPGGLDGLVDGPCENELSRNASSRPGSCKSSEENVMKHEPGASQRQTLELDAGDIERRLAQLLLVERSRPLNPCELLAKGRYIQLSSQGELLLADAERAFLKALEADPDYLPAILELAWFYHSVSDQPSQALPLFEKAYHLSMGHLREALKGKAESTVELFSGSVVSVLKELTDIARSELAGNTEEGNQGTCP